MKKENQQPLALDVNILGRVYKVACQESERKALLEAVSLLDSNMRKIHESNKAIGIERVAVIAALNLANELLRARQEVEDAQQIANTKPDDMVYLQHRLRDFTQSIDQVLNDL
jgi:Uncharacterized protein conserved in bacteria